jgi:ABC-type lipoprotein export system ATPase subunit
LTLSGVSHQFEGRPQLFSAIDESMVGGELVALTGPSGSGKSTLLAIMVGWLKPTWGSVEHSGITSVSWVFQNPYGTARRSAIDHVMLPYLARNMRAVDARARALETLHLFDLDDVAGNSFSQLSGGQAQRLMLARAVACEPALLLIDEPTAQLDQVSATSVISTITALAASDRIVVISTHDQRLSAVASRHIELGVS